MSLLTAEYLQDQQRLQVNAKKAPLLRFLRYNDNTIVIADSEDDPHVLLMEEGHGELKDAGFISIMFMHALLTIDMYSQSLKIGFDEQERLKTKEVILELLKLAGIEGLEVTAT
jgi:hypothetical protein